MTEIFVFGSNLAGIHGAGAARTALDEKNAIFGIGVGLQGNSYAIPTKDWNVRTLPYDTIKLYVDQFKQYAKMHPEMSFYVTKIGCGYAGYKDHHMAPLFVGSPDNCTFENSWSQYLGPDYTYYKFEE